MRIVVGLQLLQQALQHVVHLHVTSNTGQMAFTKLRLQPDVMVYKPELKPEQ